MLKNITLLFFFYQATFSSVGFAQTTIKMEKIGGVYKIPCKVNGLGLKFIFDTGASDVSLSLTEALFMLKNGYLSEKDFLGTEYYRIANGDIQEGTKVNLKSIEIGNQKIYNVEASIAHTTNAPLLFGQSALQRFGKFAFDYSSGQLTLGGNYNSSPTKEPQKTNLQKPENINYDNITIELGNQKWMNKNLDVGKYRNGDTIPEAKTTEDWAKYSKLGLGCWCFYRFDHEKGRKFGKLYNWFAINDSRELAPIGWHIPGDKEWDELQETVGNDGYGSPRLKSSEEWNPNAVPTLGGVEFREVNKTKGTNETGFTALPGGYCDGNGNFEGIRDWGYWWTSTNAYDEANAWIRSLNYNNYDIGRFFMRKGSGLAVRCLKD